MIQLTPWDIHRFCSKTSGVFWSTGEVVLEHLRAHRFAFNLFGSIWAHLEGSGWLFRVAEVYSYDFKTFEHFADECIINLIGNKPILCQ